MDDAILKRIQDVLVEDERSGEGLDRLDLDDLRALIAQNEALKTNNKTKREKNRRQRKFNREQEERQATLIAENARLRGALEFYADSRTWSDPVPSWDGEEIRLCETAAHLDHGHRARAALAPAPEKGESDAHP